MFIRAGIVRDHVRDHVKAALVRAILVMATLFRAGIVRDYVRAHFHSQDCQGLCQSHINLTTIVRDHIKATLVIIERWWIPGGCCSTNLMRKISIVSGRSHTADPQVKPHYFQYVHLSMSWYTCVECLRLSCPTCFPIWNSDIWLCNRIDIVNRFAGLARAIAGAEEVSSFGHIFT